jgi:hypothetical protein|nr:hypothetical protein [Neorhizobium tomejilense]
MDIRRIIEDLGNATGPDRKLDGDIAQTLGFQKKIEEITDASGQTRKRVLWLIPTGEAASGIPRYTGDIADACALALQEFPDHVGGASWEPGRGSARIDNGPFFQAATAPLALCMAILHKKLTHGA